MDLDQLKNERTPYLTPMATLESYIHTWGAMSGKNRRLVADEPVELEK